MSVKQQIKDKVNLHDEKVKNFLRGGAPVLEDVFEEEVKKEEKRKKEEEDSKWTMISMRIPEKLKIQFDEIAKQRYMNRSALLIEMIKEKVRKKRNG